MNCSLSLLTYHTGQHMILQLQHLQKKKEEKKKGIGDIYTYMYYYHYYNINPLTQNNVKQLIDELVSKIYT